MKKILAFLTAASFCMANFGDASAWTIRMTCRSKGREIELCRKAIEEWTAKYKGEHKVEIVTLPHASNECFALYQQWLSAETFDVDIMQMDVAWVGVFADCLYPLNQTFSSGEIELNDYFDAINQSMFSEEGNMIALPWYTDCGIMYYRKDLLEKYGRRVPETWEELFDTALYIQNEERKQEGKRTKFHGFVFQAKAFEILTCNFLEFVDSFGGSIVKERQATVASNEAVNAAMFMVKCINHITTHNVLNYSEEDARGVFQSGNAVFMRNWPYAWALMNDPSTSVAGKVGVMPIPKSKKGGKPSGALGGWFLVVSKYSKHPEISADLIKFLTSKAQQKYRAQFSYLPAFKSLYYEPEVIGKNPFFADLYASLNSAAVRPSLDFGKNYSRASSVIYNDVNTILTKATEKVVRESDVRYLLNKLNRKLAKLLNRPIKARKSEEKSGKTVSLWSRIKSMLGIHSK